MSRVLTALADYHYLMARQLPRIGLVTSVGAAQKLLRRFNHEIRLKAVPGRGHLYAPNPKSPIAAVRAGVDRDSGRIARLYYLTRLGAEQVAEFRQTDPQTVFYPKGDKLPLLDVLHRALTIDCWIELNRFAAAGAGEVEFFHPYFRTTGSNRVPHPQKVRPLPARGLPRHRHRAGDPATGVAPPRPGARAAESVVRVYVGEQGAFGIRDGGGAACGAERLLTRPGFEEFAPLIACSTLERLRKNFQDWWYVRGGEIKEGGLV